MSLRYASQYGFWLVMSFSVLLSGTLSAQAPAPPRELTVASGDAQVPATPLTVSGIDRTPVFSAMYVSVAGQYDAEAVEVQVANDALFSNILWSSEPIQVGAIRHGERCDNVGIDFVLDEDHVYYWRIRFTDSNGSVGAWSTDPTQFRTSDVVQEPTVIAQDIVKSQTWLWAGSPYVIAPQSVEVCVRSGAKLTLDDRDGQVVVEWAHFAIFRIGVGSETGELIALRTFRTDLGPAPRGEWTVEIRNQHNALLYISSNGSLTTIDRREPDEFAEIRREFSNESFFRVNTTWEAGAPPIAPGIRIFNAHTGRPTGEFIDPQSPSTVISSSGGTAAGTAISATQTANQLNSNDSEEGDPWGEIPDRPRYHYFDDPEDPTKGQASITEYIHGMSNYGMDGEPGEPFYGEVALEEELTEAEMWERLWFHLNTPPWESENGVLNFAYAIAGPGWLTRVKCQAQILTMASYNPPNQVYRAARSHKQLYCNIPAEAGLWKLEYTAMIHIEAGCTAGEYGATDYAAAIATGRLEFGAAASDANSDESDSHNPPIEQRTVACYSGDWYDRQGVDHPDNYPFVRVAQDADGNDELVHGADDSGTRIKVRSAEEADQDDLGDLPPKPGYEPLDRNVYATVKIAGSWSTELRDIIVEYFSFGSVFVENNEVGEWSHATSTQHKYPHAYVERKLVRVETQEKNTEGEWETVETETIANESVSITGPEREYEIVEETDSSRKVNVYQKERNKDFLKDGFWEVKVTGWSKEYDPPKAYIGLDPKIFE